MKHKGLYQLVKAALPILLIVVLLAGCQSFGATQTPAPPATSAATSTTATATITPSTSTGQTSATTPPTKMASDSMPSAEVSTAIKDVIQRGNTEQQDAFAKNDPSVMKGTATTDYYQELVQIQNDLLGAGITAIKLDKLEWGDITLKGDGTAEAGTYETWLTTYGDGSTEQSRDQNLYTLIQENGAWKIQSDVHPNDSNWPPEQTASNSPGQVTPQQGQPGQNPQSRNPRGQYPQGQSPQGQNAQGQNPQGQYPQGQRGTAVRPDVSQNWSGYAATGSTYTAVTGSWTVPEPNSDGTYGTGATWVGIGGVTSHDLIQAGTMETTDGSGRNGYQAWIEMLPNVSQQVKLAVNPGDSITVSISEQQTNQWLISLKNNTTGKSYETTVTYKSSHSSVEWIEEAASSRQGILPLYDFGTVHITGGSTVADGKTLTIAQAGAESITMLNSRGSVMATPSELTADGSGFSVERSEAVSVPQRSRVPAY